MSAITLLCPTAKVIRGQVKRGPELSVRFAPDAPVWFKEGCRSVANTGKQVAGVVAGYDKYRWPLYTAPEGVSDFETLLRESAALHAHKRAQALDNFQKDGLRIDQMENPIVAVYSERKI